MLSDDTHLKELHRATRLRRQRFIEKQKCWKLCRQFLNVLITQSKDIQIDCLLSPQCEEQKRQLEALSARKKRLRQQNTCKVHTLQYASKGPITLFAKSPSKTESPEKKKKLEQNVVAIATSLFGVFSIIFLFLYEIIYTSLTLMFAGSDDEAVLFAEKEDTNVLLTLDEFEKLHGLDPDSDCENEAPNYDMKSISKRHDSTQQCKTKSDSSKSQNNEGDDFLQQPPQKQMECVTEEEKEVSESLSTVSRVESDSFLPVSTPCTGGIKDTSYQTIFHNQLKNNEQANTQIKSKSKKCTNVTWLLKEPHIASSSQIPFFEKVHTYNFCNVILVRYFFLLLNLLFLKLLLSLRKEIKAKKGEIEDEMKCPEDNDSVKISPRDSVDLPSKTSNFSAFFLTEITDKPYIPKKLISENVNNDNTKTSLSVCDRLKDYYVPKSRSPASHMLTQKSTKKTFGIQLPQLTTSNLKCFRYEQKHQLDLEYCNSHSPRSTVSAPLWSTNKISNLLNNPGAPLSEQGRYNPYSHKLDSDTASCPRIAPNNDNDNKKKKKRLWEHQVQNPGNLTSMKASSVHTVPILTKINEYNAMTPLDDFFTKASSDFGDHSLYESATKAKKPTSSLQQAGELLLEKQEKMLERSLWKIDAQLQEIQQNDAKIVQTRQPNNGRSQDHTGLTLPVIAPRNRTKDLGSPQFAHSYSQQQKTSAVVPVKTKKSPIFKTCRQRRWKS
ncbi:hypothetical protein RFI_22416 [Reticulomyxa filosa]|uniref:Uncharacterized protein n=1 Tax=Reticulomyxa filosa TaxID=46433 RepID=X6MPF5_RETFI|nr:hypothetical protein RFI_22416 [Reticulomyxa filosa]|eukprot:ETO14950.1 hypothetical protein RFI_22416 [Reticulomyxa filosa]